MRIKTIEKLFISFLSFYRSIFSILKLIITYDLETNQQKNMVMYHSEYKTAGLHICSIIYY